MPTNQHVREFYVRPIGRWPFRRWEPTYTYVGGMERPLWPGVRFWHRLTAMRVRDAASQQYYDGLWQAAEDNKP
jgi:hypothetical protein